jgi:hypothetical protein
MALIFFLQGVNTTPFKRPWSTMTIIESYPPEGGKSVIKSFVTSEKGQVEVDFIGVNGGVVGWVLIFIC